MKFYNRFVPGEKDLSIIAENSPDDYKAKKTKELYQLINKIDLNNLTEKNLDESNDSYINNNINDISANKMNKNNKKLKFNNMLVDVFNLQNDLTTKIFENSNNNIFKSNLNHTPNNNFENAEKFSKTPNIKLEKGLQDKVIITYSNDDIKHQLRDINNGPFKELLEKLEKHLEKCMIFSSLYSYKIIKFRLQKYFNYRK